MSREEFLRRIVVAIDGPAGSGKTTTARGVSSRLGLRHIDTGAMYRAVTWKALEENLDPADQALVGAVAAALKIEFLPGNAGTQTIIADGADVTDAIRSPEVTRNVSLVSSHGPVRKAMVRLQRQLALPGGVVLEGRDIGSVVLPGAHVKVFLKASTEERARRRLLELEGKGLPRTIDQVRADLEHRDHLDSSREISPLKVPVGAHVVDTTALSIAEQVEIIVGLAGEAAERLTSRLPRSGEKNPFARQRPFYAFSCAVLRFLWRSAFGMRVSRSDELNLRENYIFASNHRSNFDPPIVGATCPREVHIMAKHTLFDSSLLGALIRYYNAIPTRRGSFDRAAFARAVEILLGGGSLLIFPEGTRSRREAFGEVKPGVGYLALETGTAVVPVYVGGSGTLGGALLRRRPLVVSFGEPIRAPNGDTSRPTPDNCREYAHMVMAAIAALRDDLECPPSQAAN